MSVAIGIDLGTTNTVVAAVHNGRAVTLADETGDKLLPSIVSFHPSGSVLVGASAAERRLVDSENTVYSVKRLIGRNWSSVEVQQARTRFAFELVEGPKESVLVRARGETYALPEISAFVLRRAKALAERALDDEVTHAVITVPANFNDLQRASTKVAGKLAGLEVLRILNEPTAAALAYGQLMGRSERIAIYDLGGGTFDITVLDLSGAVFEVLATGGDTALGGDDIDAVIADRMADAFMRAHRFDARADREAMGRLRLYGEHLKRMLSSDTLATVTLEGVGSGVGGRPLSLDFTMDREELEELSGPLLGRTLEVARTTLQAAGLREADIDKTILVGGATRMPLVPVLTASFFQKQPSQRVNPDEVVALGAAMQAYALAAAKVKPAASRRDPSPGVNLHAAPIPSGAAADAGPPSAVTKVSHTTQSFGAVARPGPPPAPPARPSQAPAGRGQAPPTPPNRPAPESAGTWEKSVPTIVFEDVSPDAEHAVEPAAVSFRRAAPELHFDIGSEPQTAVAQFRPAAAAETVRQTAAADPLPFAPSVPPFAPAAPFGPAVGSQAHRSLNSIVGSNPGAAAAPFLQQHQQQAPPPSSYTQAQAPLMPERPPLLIDVTPLNLNVETVGGYCDVLIAANSPIPVDRTRVFLTSSDNQTQANIRVAQGPARRFDENTYLGEVAVTGLPMAPRGEVRIAVTFEIDADGILNVKARDEVSGAHASARLRLLGANTDHADVEAMQRRQAQMAVS